MENIYDRVDIFMEQYYWLLLIASLLSMSKIWRDSAKEETVYWQFLFKYHVAASIGVFSLMEHYGISSFVVFALMVFGLGSGFDFVAQFFYDIAHKDLDEKDLDDK